MPLGGPHHVRPPSYRPPRLLKITSKLCIATCLLTGLGLAEASLSLFPVHLLPLAVATGAAGDLAPAAGLASALPPEVVRDDPGGPICVNDEDEFDEDGSMRCIKKNSSQNHRAAPVDHREKRQSEKSLAHVAAPISTNMTDNSSGDAFFASFPTVIIGCWQLMERHRSPEEAVKTILAYYENGFHHFDTADIYDPSEKLLGFAREMILEAARKKQGGDGVEPDESALDFHVFTKYVPSSIRESADRINENSRKSLGYLEPGARTSNSKNTASGIPLELVQFHWWDFEDGGHVAHGRELMRLQREGKITHLAVTNFDVRHLQELIEQAQYPLRVNQVQFSLLDRRPESGMLALAKRHKFKLACFGSVAGGWLSEKYLGMKQDPMQASGSGAFRKAATVSLRMYYSSMQAWSQGNWGLFQELLRKLDEIAKKMQVKIATVAAWWVLQKLETDGYGGAVIVGVRDDKHLEETKLIKKGNGGAGGKGNANLNLGKNSFLAAGDMADIQEVLDKGKFSKGEDIWSRERG